MTFSDFKYPAVVTELGLSEQSADLFAGVPAATPGPFAQAVRQSGARLGAMANTEKARSEWMVAPVLGDVWAAAEGRVNLHSGVDLDGDPDAGLTGQCDFLIGRGPQLPHIVAPVAVIFEAKKDSIVGGFGQCVAAMVGVQRFNRRAGREIDPVYGCSTTGSLWQFLRLSGAMLTIDQTEYSITQVDRILGILTHIVGPIPGRAVA
ncbi:MAG: hypothetical protein ACRC7O_00785 [Fimbriiglobus sp.]